MDEIGRLLVYIAHSNTIGCMVLKIMTFPTYVQNVVCCDKCYVFKFTLHVICIHFYTYYCT